MNVLALFVGKNPRPATLLLLALVAAAGGLYAGLHVTGPTWVVVAFAALTADVAGGLFANGLPQLNHEYRARPRLIAQFLALHLAHPAAAAWLLGGGLAWPLLVWGRILVASAIVFAGARFTSARSLAFVAVATVVLWPTPGAPQDLGWFETLLTLKLVAAFAGGVASEPPR